MLFFIYLAKVSVCITALYIMYYFLFRNNTFHQANRICLLFVIVFSFAAPLLPLAGPVNQPIPVLSVMTQSYGDLRGVAQEIKQHTSGSTDLVPSVITWVYLIGALFFSGRFIRSMIILHRLRNEATPELHKGFRVRRTALKKSFTFLNTIFLPEGDTDTIVLQHEQAHVDQRHWLDLLVAEIALILLWFYPFLRIVRNELKLQHEFLADRAVMANGVSFEEYATCLVKNMGAEQVGRNATSPFHSSSNKKRILMMTKEKTSSWKFIVYLCLVPASAVLLMSFGQKQSASDVRVKPIASTSPVQNIPDIAPVDFEKVTRVILYGERPNPAPGQMKKHQGIDFELAKGSNVFATAEGVVVFAGSGEKYGNYVRIRHSDMYSTQYSHLETATVKQGERITKGQVIGLVGNTGLSSIPHLHYEIIKDGTMVDPKDYLPKLPGL